MTQSLRFRTVIDSETKTDYLAVEQLHKQLFPGKNVGNLVKAIRKTSTFNQKASLVARVKGSVVGHIMFSSLSFSNGDDTYTNAAFIAPLAVAPDFQHAGVASKLLQSACQKAAELGYDSIYVIGDPDFYQQFDFHVCTLAQTQFPLSEQSLLVHTFKPNQQKGAIHFTIDEALLAFLLTK
ncbi:MAG: GNAT family N-acetyltransferase [Culicoidibacterales bacterium]